MIVRSSKLNDFKIKKLVWCFCVDVEASKVGLIVGLNRNTVNRFYHLFRTLIYYHQGHEFERMITGEAEIDEAYFGAKRLKGVPGKKGRGTHKQPVFGIFERKGRVYTEIVPNCKKKTLQAIIRGKIAPEVIIHTDKWRGYDGLVDVGYDKHKRINHSKAFSYRNGTHINGIENFWSFTKGRLAKFRGTKVNFEQHLKECEWRYKKSKEQLYKELIVLIKEYRKSVIS